MTELRLDGVRRVDQDVLRERLATRETPLFISRSPRWLRWWRWWWVEPRYLDGPSIVRDRQRIVRFYEARGFFDTTVTPAEVRPEGREARVRFRINEGWPTLVEDLRLRGCEDPGLRVVCANLHERIAMRVGAPFDEDTFRADRTLVRDMVRDAGYASAVVVPRAIVDPERRRAWVEYSLRPGVPSRFGAIRLVLGTERTPITGNRFPNGIPVGPVRTALGIHTGDPYSRRRLASAQQSLFDLGVFGIARIDETVRPDGDVDLDVLLSPARLWRFRLGGGFEADTSRNNVHLLVGFEHRNVFGGLRRFRIEAQPQVYFPPITQLTSSISTNLSLGVSALASLEQPELLWRASGVTSVSFDYGPDPINPQVAIRNALRGSVGFERRFSRTTSGGLFLRFSRAEFSPTESSTPSNASPVLRTDPLYRSLYSTQRYVHLEATATWDRRDDRTKPRRGFLLTGTLSGSVQNPVSDFTFVRAQADLRGYVPLGRHTVLAMRGLAGIATGTILRNADGQWVGPVPTELRFFGGGAQSNRGFPLNRLGVLGTARFRDTHGIITDDPRRTIALGGTAAWEASIEVRWQPGTFGLVGFLDFGNVVGIDPDAFVDPQGPPNSGCVGNDLNQVSDSVACSQIPLTPPLPRMSPLGADLLGRLVTNPNPSVGAGLRIATPVGPVRVDIGLRLTDLTCTRTATQLQRQNAAVASGIPSYYVLTAPRCDLFGFDDLPLVFHATLGEAF